MSDVYTIVTDRVIALLEKGVCPWRKEWSGGGLGQAANLISRRPYSGMNAFLTAAQGYESPYWLTYKQAQALGGSVRKGEKSTPILFFSKFEKLKDGKAEEFGFWRYYSAFNVEQCDGLDLPDYAKAKVERPFAPIAAAQEIVDRSTLGVRIQHGEARAYYSPALDYVNMPRPESFTAPEHYYSVLFHELTHSTGHESRLNRKFGNMFGNHDYSKEELVAEMGAAFLCAQSGLDGVTLDNNAAYLQSWIKVLKGDPKLIISAASQAQKAAKLILGVVEVKEEVAA